MSLEELMPARLLLLQLHVVDLFHEAKVEGQKLTNIAATAFCGRCFLEKIL
jgi:hypothetical protein